MLLALALGLLSLAALACLARSGEPERRRSDGTGLPLWARLAMR